MVFKEPIPVEGWQAVFAELGLADQMREAQVLRLLMGFKTDRAIAHVLGIAPKTVGRYVSRLMHRVGARSRAELLVRVLQIHLNLRGGQSPKECEQGHP